MGLELGRGGVVGPCGLGSAPLQGGRPLRMQRFSCLGHHPTGVRAGSDPEPADRSCLGMVLGGLGYSITTLIWDC